MCIRVQHQACQMCPTAAEQVDSPSSAKHRGWFPDASTPCVTTPCRDDDITEPVTRPLPEYPLQKVVECSLEVCILVDYASQALLLDRLPAKYHVVASDRITLKARCNPSAALLAPLGTPLRLAVTAAATDHHCQVAMLRGMPRWLAAMTQDDAPPHLVLSTVPGLIHLTCPGVFPPAAPQDAHPQPPHAWHAWHSALVTAQSSCSVVHRSM